MKSVFVIELSSLSKRLLNSTMLFFREDGIRIREAILSEASNSSANIIALDFNGIKVIDFSCSDEIVVTLQENNEWLKGKKLFLKNLTSSHKENIHSALEMKKLGVWVKEEHEYSIIGRLPKHLLELIKIVTEHKESTAREISDATGEELASISVKLGKLYKKGMLLRQQNKTSEGMEYIYRSIV